ncbi:hypothetical protein KAR91_10915 [Candidatus Pacearchaeota archaeon]|nr:hypothetical protein [Candidatus Pacearchaeota archaeon]
MKYKAHEYLCIVAWGRRLQSFDYYIRAQQEKAAVEEAPLTAIYERDGVWSTADEIKDPSLRKLILGNLYDEEKHGQYETRYDVESDRWDRLPRVCAAISAGFEPVLIHRGIAGKTILADDFDVERFNMQRNIDTFQVDAMLAGSMFGWDVPGADPLLYKTKASGEAILDLL